MTLPDRRRVGRLVFGAFAATVTGVAAMAGPALAAPTGEVRYAGSPDAVAGSYIVVLSDDAVGAAGTQRARAEVPAQASRASPGRYGGNVARTFERRSSTASRRR